VRTMSIQTEPNSRTRVRYAVLRKFISRGMSGEPHLRRTLKIYAAYYNDVRMHLSLDKDAPKGLTASSRCLFSVDFITI
jgi:hypothetical protein